MSTIPIVGQRIKRYLSDHSLFARKTHFYALFGVTLLIAFTIIHTGTPVLFIWGHDIFIPLDGAWRMFQGQAPHADFYSPFGLFNFIPTLMGMKIARPTSEAIAYGNSLFFIAITFWAWATAFPRMSPPIACAFALLTGFTFCAPISLGDAYSMTSFASLFNRYAYGYLMILFAGLFCPRAEGEREWPLIDGMAIGALLALLLFSKLNFFGFGALCTIAALASDRGRALKLKAAGAAGAFAFTSLCALATTRYSISAWLGDGMAAVRTKFSASYGSSAVGHSWMEVISSIANPNPESVGVSRFLGMGLANLETFVLLAFLWWFVEKTATWTKPERNRIRLIALFAALDLFLAATNFQLRSLPLVGVASLILLELALRKAVAHAGAPDGAIAAILLAASLLSLPPMLNQGGALGYAAAVKTLTFEDRKFEFAMDTEPYSDMAIVRSTGQCPVPYAFRYNDGVKLLHLKGGTNPRVLVFDFANPFTFGMALTPPRGGVTNFGFPTTFSETAVERERLFDDVSTVLIPKCPELGLATSKLVGLYLPYVEKTFPVRAETENWKMYSRH